MTSSAIFAPAITPVILSEVARAFASYAVEGPRRFSRHLDLSLHSDNKSGCPIHGVASSRHEWAATDLFATPRCRCRVSLRARTSPKFNPKQ